MPSGNITKRIVKGGKRGRIEEFLLVFAKTQTDYFFSQSQKNCLALPMYERRRYVIDMLSLLRQTVRTNTLAAVLNFHAFYFTLSPSLSVKITLSIQSLSHSIYSFFFYSLSLSIFSDRFPTEQKSV
jgi:hypothetical protein